MYLERTQFGQRPFLLVLTIHGVLAIHLCLTFTELLLLNTSKMACIIPHLFGFDRSDLFCVSGNKTVEMQHADVDLMLCV